MMMNVVSFLQTGIQVTKEYTLHAHVPILKDVPAGWNLVLVDTPGFGEANMESITSLATTLLNTSSAYLYIVDVNSIGDETDSKNMKCIFDKDQSEAQCKIEKCVDTVLHFCSL